jgi:myotubularin-related protein 1/2
LLSLILKFKLTTNDPNKSPQTQAHNLHHLNNIKEIAGVVNGPSASNMSNKSNGNTNGESAIINTLINSVNNKHNSPLAPPSLSLKSISNTSSSKHSKSHSNRMPWIFLDGEFLVNKSDDSASGASSTSPDCIQNSSTSIIFVLPDNRGVRGRLHISNFRLYFRSADELNIIIDLPLGLINRIEKIGHQSARQTNFYGFLISCKNGRRLRFACTTSLNDENNTSRKQIFELIQRYAFPISNQLEFFAYSYRPNSNAYIDNSGWFVYDAKQEYERIGILKSSEWRFTSINQHFKFCDTYPKVLVVPHSVTDDDLRQIGEFRSKHRIPVVSWLKYDSRKNSVALLRSSQPLVGLTNKRSEKDESYLYCIYKMNTINSLDKLFIMDARPLVSLRRLIIFEYCKTRLLSLENWTLLVVFN